jgi:hypothetical protein
MQWHDIEEKKRAQYLKNASIINNHTIEMYTKIVIMHSNNP